MLFIAIATLAMLRHINVLFHTDHIIHDEPFYSKAEKNQDEANTVARQLNLIKQKVQLKKL